MLEALTLKYNLIHKKLKRNYSNIISQYYANITAILCQQYELKIMNGFFAHKDIHKYTWYQHTWGIKSIIDYIVLKQQTNIRVQDVKVNRGAECGSDHCLVVAKIYIPFPGVRLGKTEGSSAMLENVQYKLDSFENESTRLLYSWRLERKLNELERSTTEEYEHIKDCIKAAAEEALGIDNNQKYNRPYWWDREIEEKIRHKKEYIKNYSKVETMKQGKSIKG